jgi:hypothetical protein
MIKVVCIKDDTTFSTPLDYRVKCGEVYYIEKYYIGRSYYSIRNKNNEWLGFFYKDVFLIQEELREQIINKILEND